MRDHEDFATNYARAREIGDDVEFERLTDMASEEPERGKFGVDPGWVNWQKNRIDTFKWCLARKRPKKYGEKIQQEVTGKDGNPLQIVVVGIDKE